MENEPWLAIPTPLELPIVVEVAAWENVMVMAAEASPTQLNPSNAVA